MSDKITLDQVDFQDLKDRAGSARAEYLRRHAVPALGAVGSTLSAHYVIAITAILLISFGIKMFFLSAPTAEADTIAVRSTSMDAHQMNLDHAHNNNLPRSR
jgi:hypothetical protein